MRQSERSKSLTWTKAAVDKIWSWTHGHPYFTQLLCSVVWDHAHEESSSETPRAGVDEVNIAIKDALKRGANAFQWIWDGLPPAERVVSAAMAEAGDEIITQDELAEILRRSGVRLIVRELELAPDTLVEWEVLEPAENGYRFMVPLLRRWVEDNRPLRRVKDELDRLDPLAENLFQAGQGFYIQEQLEEAENQLRQALRINPNHLKSRLLLGRILLERKQLTEAVDVLDEAYQYDSIAVRADLVKALLALAETKTEDTQLAIYDKVLSIDEMQVAARERRSAIWVRKGESELAQNNLDAAITAFKEAGDKERVQQALNKKRESIITPKLLEAEKHESDGKWETAIEIYEAILKEYPDETRLIEGLKKARIGLASKYETDENWKEAARIYDEIQKISSGDETILERARNAKIKAAEIFETDGNWQAAVVEYRQLAQSYPNDEAIGNKYEKAKRQFKDSGFQAAGLYETDGNWAKALEIYETLALEYPDDDRITDRLKNAKMQMADQNEMSKNWDKAVNIYESLLQKHVGDKGIEERLEKAKAQAKLLNKYNQAIATLEGGASKKAQRLLADIIYEQPDFEDAAAQLLLATKGYNVYFQKAVSPQPQKGNLWIWSLVSIVLGLATVVDADFSDGAISFLFLIPITTFLLSYFRPIKWWQILLFQLVPVIFVGISDYYYIEDFILIFLGISLVWTLICTIIARFGRQRREKFQPLSDVLKQHTTTSDKSKAEKLLLSQKDINIDTKDSLEEEQIPRQSNLSAYFQRATKPIIIISSVLAVIYLFMFLQMGEGIDAVGMAIISWLAIFIFGYLLTASIFIVRKTFNYIRQPKQTVPNINPDKTIQKSQADAAKKYFEDLFLGKTNTQTESETGKRLRKNLKLWWIWIGILFADNFFSVLAMDDIFFLAALGITPITLAILSFFFPIKWWQSILFILALPWSIFFGVGGLSVEDFWIVYLIAIFYTIGSILISYFGHSRLKKKAGK